jgi:predicted  nucleic acid-binding Zn-ribbon protein
MTDRELRLRQRIDTLTDRLERSEKQLAKLRDVRDSLQRKVNSLEGRFATACRRAEDWRLIAERETAKARKRAA